MESQSFKIARFIQSLSRNIANKVNLQPYLSFDDEHNLTLQVEIPLKGWKSFQTSSTKSLFTHIEIKTPPLQVKVLDKGKSIASESPKKLG